MSLYLFDDGPARAWEPFRATRPVGEMLFGCLLQRQRAERFWKGSCLGHLAGPELSGYDELHAPPVVEPEELDPGTPRILWSSRAVPRGEAPQPDEPATVRVEGTVAGWVLPPGEPLPGPEALLEPDAAPVVGRPLDAEGAWLARPWDLMALNAERIARDVVDLLHPHSDAFLPAGIQRIGHEPVSLGRRVQLEPGVLLDTREGAIRLDDGVRVQAPARLAGPLYVGRDTALLGGSIGSSSIGPVCRIRGEVESSVILAYTNKAHDGFLGHAVLGRWVNLGAGTTNSDLKNDYGPVRVPTSDGPVDTGMRKVGCFLGDHVKTGIGTLLNTGTVVGAGSNLFGGAMPPTWVPPFSWGSGRELVEYRVDKIVEVARTVMARRDVELSPGAEAFLRATWERTRPLRRGMEGAGA